MEDDPSGRASRLGGSGAVGMGVRGEERRSDGGGRAEGGIVADHGVEGVHGVVPMESVWVVVENEQRRHGRAECSDQRYITKYSS